MTTTASPLTPLTAPMPSRVSYRKGAFVSFLPAAGWLTVVTDPRKPALYRVRELPAAAEFRGRGFSCDKVVGGSDAEAEGYDCLVSNVGPGWDTCECKGFLRHGHCRHLDGLRITLRNGWWTNPTPAAA